jgi:hypothetical protein
MNTAVLPWLKTAYQRYESWLLATVDARIPAFFRIVFGIVMFMNVALWFTHSTAYFSGEGYYTSAEALAASSPLSLSLFYHWDSPLVINLAVALTVLCIVCYTLGFGTRIAQILLLILMVSFHNRDRALFHSGDLMIRILLLVTLPLVLDGVWSLRAKWRGVIAQVPAWPVRLMRLQLAFLYLVTVTGKLTVGDQWLGGTFTIKALGSIDRGFFSWDWLAAYPLLGALMTYWVLFGDVQFAFLYWFPKTRRFSLLIVAFFHLMVMLTMSVVYFSEIMFAALTLALHAEDFDDFARWWGRVREKVRGGVPRFQAR